MSQENYFNISERRFFLRIIDVLAIILSDFISFRFLEFNYLDFKNENIFIWLSLLIGYFLVFGQIFQLFSLNISNNRYLVFRSIAVTALITTVFYVFTPYLSPELPKNRFQILYLFLILSIPVTIWRFIYIQFIFSPKFFKTVIFIGKKDRIEKVIRKTSQDNFHFIKGYFSDEPIAGVAGFKDINQIQLFDYITNETVNELVVSKYGFSKPIINSLNKDLISLFQKGINITSFESFYEEMNSRIPKEYLEHNFYKYMNFSKNNTNRFYLFSLRFVDIVISLTGLFIFLFIIPFLFIGNLFGNSGKLFYSQVRVGQNGKHFKIFKLRSMVANAEKNGAVWAKKNDVRITSFGKFLRNTRLDEVPQFFNILKGDMSIIGPRPERPEFVKELEDQIPFYAIRNVVRPGLTGWAQVNYPYANTIEEQETKLRYDLYYIKERNTFLDFKIMIKTITTVLFFRGQ